MAVIGPGMEPQELVELTLKAVQEMIDQHQQLPGNIRRVGGVRGLGWCSALSSPGGERKVCRGGQQPKLIKGIFSKINIWPTYNNNKLFLHSCSFLLKP